MFGYVKSYQPELKIAEFETYKAVYCSLCRQLGKSYGVLSRLILSYDFTFLAMLLLAGEPQCCGYTTMRCPFNPLKKCHRLQQPSDSLSYTAACAVILFYCKIADNIADGGFFKRLQYRLIRLFYRRAHKKAARDYPEIESAAANMMQRQAALERGGCDSLDRAAEPTALLLQEMFAHGQTDPIKQRVLQQMGYCAGKWIYLADALDDLSQDLQSGGYNPVALRFGLSDGSDRAQAEAQTRALLNVCNAQLAAAFELLQIRRYGTILGNIIYLGMPDVIKNLHKRRRPPKDKTGEPVVTASAAADCERNGLKE